MKAISIIAIYIILISGCIGKKSADRFPEPQPQNLPNENLLSDFDRSEYRNKVLGMLVGSAIGDAMGAPTEMWNRDDIKIQKGYVHSLDPVIRERSPEGTWRTNLPAGSTTDDTRWKYLMVEYMMTQSEDLNAREFARHIVEVYDQFDAGYNDYNLSYQQLNQTLEQKSWLIEWVNVAKPYMSGNLDDYNYALSKFYGGEMACAGMLYAPVIGAYFPGMPEMAYESSFKLAIFDIGYARDITGLTAAFVATAMQPGIEIEEIGKVTETVDPKGYFKSRLIGRITYQIYKDAKKIAYQAKNLMLSDIESGGKITPGYAGDSLYFFQQERAYDLLDSKLQDIPFHAAEIHLINLTAIAFTGGDFRKAMEFVVNYGRDNDTVAAVTGAILGGFWGYDHLPPDLVNQSLKINKHVLNIDLVQLADELVSHRFPAP